MEEIELQKEIGRTEKHLIELENTLIIAKDTDTVLTIIESLDVQRWRLEELYKSLEREL